MRPTMQFSTGVLLLSLIGAAAVEAKQPNVVFIVADDLGWDDVGFHGSTQVKTPNLDAFAAKSVILDSHYVNPLCSPSRASLLTGRYADQMGLQHSVIVQGQRVGVPLNVTMLPAMLRAGAGYATHAVGKWHLGFYKKEYTPTYRGFDSFYGFYNENIDYWDHTSDIDYTLTDSHNLYWGLDWHFDENGTLGMQWNEFGYYSNHLVTDRAVNILANYSTQHQPLFLYLAWQGVHAGNEDMPLEAPATDVNQFPNIWDQRRRFQAGMIKNMDSAMGRVFDALEKYGYMDDTMIIFLTDNGGPIGGCDYSWASNYPLRGSKHTLWEGGVRGVTFAYGANFADLGEVKNDLFHVSDWVPTVLDAAGIEIPPSGLDGISQYNTLVKGWPTERLELLHNIDQNTNYSAVRVGDFKLIVGKFNDAYNGCPDADAWYSPPGDTPTSKYKNKNSTIKCKSPPLFGHTCSSKTFGEACMYNIADDPCEYDNLIDDESYADVRRVLFARLDRYYEEAVVPNWPLMDPLCSPRFYNFTWVPWVHDDSAQPQIDFVHLKPVF